jgi:uncharacterized membrane protein
MSVPVEPFMTSRQARLCTRWSLAVLGWLLVVLLGVVFAPLVSGFTLLAVGVFVVSCLSVNGYLFLLLVDAYVMEASSD